MKMTRRHLFQMSMLLAASATTMGRWAQKAWAQGVALIDMTLKKRKDEVNKKAVEIAKGLNYVENLEAALKSKKITKSEMKSADGRTFKPNQQRCDNCLYFDMQNKKVDSCALIPGVLVHKPGSCNQWQPKQKS